MLIIGFHSIFTSGTIQSIDLVKKIYEQSKCFLETIKWEAPFFHV